LSGLQSRPQIYLRSTKDVFGHQIGDFLCCRMDIPSTGSGGGGGGGGGVCGEEKYSIFYILGVGVLRI